jgi:hypothetical protein
VFFEEIIWFIKLNIENNILLFKGVLLSSARHPSLDALQWIPSISLIGKWVCLWPDMGCHIKCHSPYYSCYIYILGFEVWGVDSTFKDSDPSPTKERPNMVHLDAIRFITFRRPERMMTQNGRVTSILICLHQSKTTNRRNREERFNVGVRGVFLAWVMLRR